MIKEKFDTFLELIQTQFREEDRAIITGETDLTTLKEWSSLQTIIIVNEIDKQYKILLSVEDMRRAKTVNELYEIIERRSS
jgi:acyl carrier protein